MVLFLCSPEQVKHRSVSCCILCMCTQHIKGECPLVMGLLEEGAKDLWHQESRVLAWSFTYKWCSQFVLLRPLEVYHCLGVWIIPLMFYVYTLHVSVLGRTGSSFISVIRLLEFLQYQWKDVAVFSLGKKKESACLTYLTQTLGSNSNLKTENYLSLITISVSFLLKMWEHNPSRKSILIYILLSIL